MPELVFRQIAAGSGGASVVAACAVRLGGDAPSQDHADNRSGVRQ